MRINTKQGIAPIAVIIIALLAVGGGGYAIKKGMDKTKEKKEKQEQVAKDEMGTKDEKTPTTLQVKLDEQNASGQAGQVVIAAVGTSTLRVIVNLAGKPSGVAQPAHIHLGSCPNPGGIRYPLTNVGNGASQTDIPNMTIKQLLSELPLAINVHKSATEASVYVACGNITDGKVATEKPDTVAKETKISKVTYTSAGFAPKSITVRKGETVVFENKTGKAASVASDEHPTHLLYSEFDQYKTDQRGNTEFRFTFTKVGSWDYHDHLNASMGGTVVVTE